MKIYLVGGAVRDALLGLPVHEKDWVVVGGTPEQMIDLGYRPVGRDFPVFLHPHTQEEYALARLERKVAPGYRGFVTEFSPDVSLEEDLKRRDLTINAMAQDSTGQIIDPYHGRADLSARILRHVSEAFVEDPVRILRVARFLARFAHLGFQVAPATLMLMQQMTEAGETDALVPERVWRELERLLMAASPATGIRLLEDCNAWRSMLPGLPNGHFSQDTLRALQNAADSAASAPVRFAVLLNELSSTDIEACSDGWRVPTEHRELALLVKRLRASCQTLAAATTGGGADTADAQLALLESADAFRRPERFLDLLIAIDALEDHEPSMSALCQRLRQALAVTRPVKLTSDETRLLSGPALGRALREKRLQILQQQ